MRRWLRMTCGVGVAVCGWLLLSPGSVGAVDKKIFGGNACLAANGADQSKLVYGGGVVNASQSFVNAFCPLYRDDTLNEDGFDYLEMRVNKQSADSVTCVARCGSFNTSIDSDSQQAASGSTEATLYFDDFASAVNGQCQIKCGLPTGAGIRYYEWHE